MVGIDRGRGRGGSLDFLSDYRDIPMSLVRQQRTVRDRNSFLNLRPKTTSSSQKSRRPKTSIIRSHARVSHGFSASLVTWLAVRSRWLPTLTQTRDGVCMRALRHRSPRARPLDSMNLFVTARHDRLVMHAAQRMCCVCMDVCTSVD